MTSNRVPPVSAATAINADNFNLASNPTAAAGSSGWAAPTASTSGLHQSTSKLTPRSCKTCRRRKVKCDKKYPCSNCHKAQEHCEFPPAGRAPRRSKKNENFEVAARLRRLEGMMQELGGHRNRIDGDRTDRAERDASGNGDENEMDEMDLTKDTAELGKKFGRLVVDAGKSRYVADSFWTTITDEMDDLHGMLDSSSEDEDIDTASPASNPTINPSDSHHGFLFGYACSRSSILELHPPVAHATILWEVYLSSVDPLLKISHAPTTQVQILSAAGDLRNVSRAVESLMFSIYFASVTSMSDEQCLSMLGESKSVLVDRYWFATEQALSLASFLNTNEIVVLQAFVLFLICVRRYDGTRFVWTLTGLAIRIAQSLGLHRDGSAFGLPPLETELRRRLWWHICIADVRSSEDHGSDPLITEQIFDTRMPLNINDADISATSVVAPPERIGQSEMCFPIVRFEVAHTTRRFYYNPPNPDGPLKYGPLSSLQREGIPVAEKERAIEACHARLELTYLRHLDMTDPLSWVSATVTRLIMAKMWLMLYSPFKRKDGGAEQTPATRDRLFLTSIRVIEYARVLETAEATERWGWLFHTFVQWHAIRFILAALCEEAREEHVERAWTAVEGVFEGWGEEVKGKDKGELWRPMRKLMRRARSVREAKVRKRVTEEEERRRKATTDAESRGSDVPRATERATEARADVDLRGGQAPAEEMQVWDSYMPFDNQEAARTTLRDVLDEVEIMRSPGMRHDEDMASVGVGEYAIPLPRGGYAASRPVELNSPQIDSTHALQTGTTMYPATPLPPTQEVLHQQHQQYQQLEAVRFATFFPNQPLTAPDPRAFQPPLLQIQPTDAATRYSQSLASRNLSPQQPPGGSHHLSLSQPLAPYLPLNGSTPTSNNTTPTNSSNTAAMLATPPTMPASMADFSALTAHFNRQQAQLQDQHVKGINSNGVVALDGVDMYADMVGNDAQDNSAMESWPQWEQKVKDRHDVGWG